MAIGTGTGSETSSSTTTNTIEPFHERGQMGGIYEHGDLQSQDAQRDKMQKHNHEVFSNTNTRSAESGCTDTSVAVSQSQDAETQPR